MKITKEQMVDYIYHNFKIKGGKLTKKLLNEYSYEELENIIKKNNCENKLEAWINQPKTIKFIVDGIHNGKKYSYDCEYINEEECRKEFEADGIKIEKIAKKSTHHRCKYCGCIANGTNKDVLCEDCKNIFGHKYYSEL